MICKRRTSLRGIVTRPAVYHLWYPYYYYYYYDRKRNNSTPFNVMESIIRPVTETETRRIDYAVRHASSIAPATSAVLRASFVRQARTFSCLYSVHFSRESGNNSLAEIVYNARLHDCEEGRRPLTDQESQRRVNRTWSNLSSNCFREIAYKLINATRHAHILTRTTSTLHKRCPSSGSSRISGSNFVRWSFFLIFPPHNKI